MEIAAKILTVLFLVVFFIACAQQKPLIDRLLEAELEVAGVRVLPPDELPPGATGGQAFVIPSHCDGCGGKILRFTREDDARKMGDAWRALGQHIYIRDTTLLQINGSIDKSVADQYGDIVAQ